MTEFRCFIAANWPVPEGITAGTTLRHRGVSSGAYDSFNLGATVGDDLAAVKQNRRRFKSACGLPAEPLWLKQVHGTTVVTHPARNPDSAADAAVSAAPGTTCAVLTADCLPVLFVSRNGREIGAAHAGWRGLAAGVLEATVRSFSSDPADLLAWLGPAISQPAFEVGAEVRQEFVANDPAAEGCFVANPRGRWQADLYALARRRLSRAGVTRVSGGDFCTFGEPGRFFSYRRDRVTGRMASLIWLSEFSPGSLVRKENK